ncbi:hypothetical protein [Hyphomicrobium sp.]|uniref:hypothetical protein n=1 Tax=Hyphomicrobium sp. TaxID=82 RepID=UPI002D773F71|nr:hypothetical protein [Hyphomicrobium sp.]HET6389871.1 hypothetical protein [Hyphomicrobium sp.]
MLIRTCAAVIAALLIPAAAIGGSTIADDDPDRSAGSISQLMKSGWQIAGYASNSDNRSTFILFKHPNETYLVQCMAGYDVTRAPRVFQNCYRLR